jgi:hypothetical protein
MHLRLPSSWGGDCANDSAPSEARKRGSGGGSPRKYDDTLTGPSDLFPSAKKADTKDRPSQRSFFHACTFVCLHLGGDCANDSAPSEARKRGSGGGSPRKYDDTLTGPSDLFREPSSSGHRAFEAPQRILRQLLTKWARS